MIVKDSSQNFLGITENDLFEYKTSKCIIQQLPYERTSSYKKGSDKGPEAILYNSHFVEYYDPELDAEAYKKCGIASLEPTDLQGNVDEDAMNIIHQETTKHLSNEKFLVSLGAEHTVSYGIFKAFKEISSEEADR